MSKNELLTAFHREVAELHVVGVGVELHGAGQQQGQPKQPLSSGCPFKGKGVFVGIFTYISCTVFNTASSVAPQIPLYRRMLYLNPRLLHYLHWQPDALTNRLDLIHRLD